MTEEQAKSKWCPFVRTDGMNRHWGGGGASAPISQCIASACMAWRLLEDRHEYIDLPEGEKPDGEGWSREGEGFEPTEWSWTRKLTDLGGYCGLSGHQA